MNYKENAKREDIKILNQN